MNILFYSLDGFNPKQGGVESATNNLSKGFIKNGHNVFYIALHPENYTPVFPHFTLVDQKNICSERNIADFIDFVNTHNIDIIICQHSYTEDFAMLAHTVKQKTGVKLIFVFHTTPDFMALSIQETSYPILLSEKTLPRHYRRIQRILFKKQKQKSRNKKIGKQIRLLYNISDGIVFLSEKYIPLTLQISGITTTDKFYCIGNANTYQPEDVEWVEKENTLLFVGRLCAEKRPEKVMRMWQNIQHQFPDWNVKIIGTGYLENELNKLKTKMRLERCTFEGRQDPQPYYEKAKILLVPSDFEGFGVVITEAMQHGVLPVVFNSYAALSDIIENDVTGVSVTPYKLGEFQEKTVQLMANEEKLAKMAEKGKISVEKFALPNIIKQWEKLFEDLKNKS